MNNFDYVFFRLNLLRIIDTKYAIIIKNNEKPKAETNETPPEPGLTYFFHPFVTV